MSKKMSAKAALAKALLDGYVITCRNCLDLCALHNPSREISRQIEDPVKGFGVRVSRTRQEGKSRFGQSIYWFTYRLNTDDPENAEGVEKMRAYVKERFVNSQPPLPFQ